MDEEVCKLSPTHCPISWAIFTSVAVDCIDSFPLDPQEKKEGERSYCHFADAFFMWHVRGTALPCATGIKWLEMCGHSQYMKAGERHCGLA